MEETPLAVYDAVLDTMWAGQEADIKKIKGSLSNDPDQHTGFVSMQRGVYADRDLAVVYIADSDASAELFGRENAADFLYMLANPDVRKIMKYQLENRGVTYTLSSVSVLWSSFFVTLVAKKYRLATMLPFEPRMVCDSR